MADKTKKWKKGRGKLGILDPLMGSWVADADSAQGPVHCTRVFTKVLRGAYVQLSANWTFAGGSYQELALYGIGPEGHLDFWSFTSDGKQSHGRLADVSDIQSLAIGFEAEMPAGLGRMAYWPDEVGGFFWVVEARMKNGWKRFTEHHYRPAS